MKAVVAAFNQKKGPSRDIILDCKTSNFAKVRFQLYCVYT